MPPPLPVFVLVDISGDLVTRRGKVLADTPPGVFDPRSWAYWHVVLGLDPERELPRRRF